MLIVILFIALGLQCGWLASTDGIGDDEVAIGFLTENECAKQCAVRKVSDQRINGATIRKSDGECFCEIGMKSQSSDQTYNSCFFEGKNIYKSDGKRWCEIGMKTQVTDQT